MKLAAVTVRASGALVAMTGLTLSRSSVGVAAQRGSSSIVSNDSSTDLHRLEWMHISVNKIPMTAAGYLVLEDELKHRTQVERPRLIQQI